MIVIKGNSIENVFVTKTSMKIIVRHVYDFIFDVYYYCQSEVSNSIRLHIFEIFGNFQVVALCLW